MAHSTPNWLCGARQTTSSTQSLHSLTPTPRRSSQRSRAGHAQRRLTTFPIPRSVSRRRAHLCVSSCTCQTLCRLDLPGPALTPPPPFRHPEGLRQDRSRAAHHAPPPSDTMDFSRDHLVGHQNRPNSDIVRKQPFPAQPITATTERLTVSQLTNTR